MSKLSQEKRYAVWDRYLPERPWGMDAYGHWMYKYAPEGTPLAWEVDHIFPKKHLETIGVESKEIDHPDNLWPMHHSVNSAKRESYPLFTATRFSCYNALLGRPPMVEQTFIVPVPIQARLLKLYAGKIATFLTALQPGIPTPEKNAGDKLAAWNAICTSCLCVQAYVDMLQQRLSPNLAGLLLAAQKHANEHLAQENDSCRHRLSLQTDRPAVFHFHDIADAAV